MRAESDTVLCRFASAVAHFEREKQIHRLQNEESNHESMGIQSQYKCA